MGWFLAIAANIFVIFTLALIVSPYGSIRIGGPDARAEFLRLSWFVMLFAAEMGIELRFYGVGEPVSHFAGSYAEDADQPGSCAPLAGAVGDATMAMQLAMPAAATLASMPVTPAGVLLRPRW